MRDPRPVGKCWPLQRAVDEKAVVVAYESCRDTDGQNIDTLFTHRYNNSIITQVFLITLGTLSDLAGPFY